MLTMSAEKNLICIEACTKCAQACYKCFYACINEPDLNARKSCVSILIECAMMCQMSVSMMSMNGQFSKEHCALCARICDSCAKECNTFNDEHCQKCAQECRSCADECRNMAGM
ncbi:MAG: ferredoxin [Herbinix sp.]|jgi:hypothetical protein|nr:ferredoxin [Herbinix sp.]